MSVKSKRAPSMQKTYIWNPAIFSCENVKYVGSIIYDLVIKDDENIEETKTVSTKSTSTKAIPAKSYSTNFYILLAVLFNYYNIDNF